MSFFIEKTPHDQTFVPIPGTHDLKFNDSPCKRIHKMIEKNVFWQTHRKANTTLGFIMKFLEKNKEKECKGYDGTTIFEHAVVCLRVSLVQEMLEGEKVSNINELNEEGKAPLHMIEGITYEDNIDTILQLIQILFVYGAYPNVRDKNGNTLLLLMSARGGTENEQVNIVNHSIIN